MMELFLKQAGLIGAGYVDHLNHKVDVEARLHVLDLSQTAGILLALFLTIILVVGMVIAYYKWDATATREHNKRMDMLERERDEAQAAARKLNIELLRARGKNAEADRAERAARNNFL